MMLKLIDALLRKGSIYVGSPEGDPVVICVILFVFIFSALFIGTTVFNIFRKKR